MYIYRSLLCLFLLCTMPLHGVLTQKQLEVMEANIPESKFLDGSSLTYRILTKEEMQHLIDTEVPKERMEYLESVGPYQSYKLITGKLQPGKTYEVYSLDLLGRLVHVHDLIVNKQGDLVEKDSKRPSNKFSYFGNYLKGETLKHYLIAKDHKSWFSTLVIPNPLEVVGKRGQKISAHIVGLDPEIYTVKGTGFLPNEEFSLTSQSGKERIESKQKANEKGEFVTMYSPDLMGQKGGIATQTYTLKNETLKLSFHWGSKLNISEF